MVFSLRSSTGQPIFDSIVAMPKVMKKRPLFSLLTSSLLIFSGGCQFLPGGGGNDQTADVNADGQPDAAPEVPLVTVKPLPPVDINALGLIAPTTPGERLGSIQIGRPNPFELIPVNATVQQPVFTGVDADGDGKIDVGVDGVEVAADGKNGAGKGTNPFGVVPVKGSGNKTGGSASSKLKPGASAGKGSVSSPLDQIIPPEPPPPLFPNDARAVVVSGIIEIGSKPFAIVKAPGEPVARNVTVGDRLSDGKVLVKSITALGSTPSVELEQYGDIVTRDVGSPALPPLPAAPAPEKEEKEESDLESPEAKTTVSFNP